MHLSIEDIAKLFNEKFGSPLDSTAEQLTQKARELLREKYLQADVGISGANFLIADTGSIGITENEGNARLTTSFPKIHIAVVGIEKMIPSIADLDTFWPMLATHGTGQNLTVYNTILSGPRQTNETDGPEEMYVVLLDNGRTNLLAQKEQRQGLYCIRCGACLNVCPVFQNVGGHTYDTTYGGPIGSVIAPHMRGMEEFKHLSYASSLCGKCTEVCPVKIDIHKMLLLNRRDAVNDGLVATKEKWGWAGWKKGMLKRSLTDFFSGKTKNFLMKTFFKKSWGHYKEMPRSIAKIIQPDVEGWETPRITTPMRKIILNLAVSLDGFIEGPNGEYDWCLADQDYGMEAFFAKTDTLFIGRKSFELIRADAASFPVKHIYVFSDTLVPEPGENISVISSANYESAVAAIMEADGGDIWLFGGAELVTSLYEQTIGERVAVSHPPNSFRRGETPVSGY
jgi:dihydrofolate reductase/ferredoxin